MSCAPIWWLKRKSFVKRVCMQWNNFICLSEFRGFFYEMVFLIHFVDTVHRCIPLYKLNTLFHKLVTKDGRELMTHFSVDDIGWSFTICVLLAHCPFLCSQLSWCVFIVKLKSIQFYSQKLRLFYTQKR